MAGLHVRLASVLEEAISTNNMVTWNNGEDRAPQFRKQLSPAEEGDLENIFKEVSGVLNSEPECTNLTKHHIVTTNARPVRLPLY